MTTPKKSTPLVFTMIPVGMVCSSTGFLFFSDNLVLKYGLMVFGIVLVLTAAVMIVRAGAAKDPE